MEKTQTNICKLQKVIAKSCYRKIKSRSQKLFEAKKEIPITCREATKAQLISKSSWYRAKKAEKEGREVGRIGRELAISDSELEIIENQCVELKQKRNESANKEVNFDKKYAYKLLKRSEIIHTAVAKPLEAAKIIAQSPESIRTWFADLAELEKKYNIVGSAIFNFDETSVRCGQEASKLVVCLKDQLPPSPPAPQKVFNATMCFCVCADGSCLNHYLLWPNRTIPAEFSNFPSFSIKYLYASSGWITNDLFETIFINDWLIQIKEKVKPTRLRRALILMDNHVTHFCPEVITAAKNSHIIIKYFPPNMTHLLQPCDSCIFSRFKSVLNNQLHIPHPFSLHSYRFALSQVLPDAIAAAIQPSTIRTAFLKTGVWPITATEVLSRVCGSSKQIFGEKKAINSSTDLQSELFGKFSPTKKMDKKPNFDEKSAITQPSCLKDTEDLQRELDVLCNRVEQIKKQLEGATEPKNDEDENLNVMKK
ncbi:putative DDE superfamily endonuclease [Monocercomonoides exilis]|uniref:putative DDE superfamily endonuclease n=1 Tax=Monocercomonoides exilis TaxID=2049356 RepID=UPI00355A4FB1|nr:putative DDE superfamily endonuclease [Monocercomonoides exilis]|eukprot:MONOS_11274.1-p1 / transcript=MONOS_11274.1 / gene=MONOS_11274 / organism=Monocercomonoides_exilis_PA203 / gene_product=transposase Tan1-Aspergillus niger / transcript_product=transposase Tan1-Aspergillus niger / location=Mono_scaffold00557:30576-32123(-) / protein_length=480 / sequence_SO=supercontig / SO=protein_coding / is_pseudo=false